MNMKKIISSLLTVVMVFGMAVALIPTRVEAAHSGSVATENDLSAEEIKAIVNATYKYKFSSALEMLNYELENNYLDFVKSKSGSHSIYVNRYTGLMYYVNNSTGEILTSNPYDVSATSGDGTPQNLMSQIFLSYTESANATKGGDYNSAKWCAEYAQLKISKISGGLRVNYTLGDTSTRFLLPGMISTQNFIEFIIKPMLSYYEEMLELYCREDAPDEQFDFFAEDVYDSMAVVDDDGFINRDAIRAFLIKTQAVYSKIYTESYYAERKALQKINDDINIFIGKYTEKRSSEPGKSHYALNTERVSDKRMAANILGTYCPDYTMDLVLEHEAEMGYVSKVEQKPVFRCSLEYTFNEDGSLNVRLPANSITFDQTVYTLHSISAMRYFGAGHLDESGYVFIPDGSGSVIEFDDFYDKDELDLRKNVSLKLKTYGEDYCYSMLDPSAANREQITMPVYGAAYEIAANETVASISGKDKVKSGYFAIMEEGSTLASLQVEFGGGQHKFGNVYTIFNPFPNDKYDLSDTISVSGLSEVTLVSESKYTGSYTTRYVMLSDAAVSVPAGVVDYVPASYSGMASYYRNYLESKGEISPLSEAAEDLPLYIEAFGSIDVVKRIMTFPVTVSIPLTTFEDVTTMYDELAMAKAKLLEKAAEYDKLAEEAEADENMSLAKSNKERADRYRELSEKVYNITNVNFKLTGFTNGGMYYTYPTKVKWQKACGGKSGFKDLLLDVKNRQDQGLNFNVYPDFDFQYINNTSLFDGISNKGNVSKMVDNRYASKQEVNSILKEYESLFAMVISPDALDKLYSKFYSKYSRYGLTNISVSTLGSDLNSNFDKNNPINREESSQYVVELLDRMVDENNMSVLLSKGNMYSVKYADHIIDISTDSSHFSDSSYSVPFIGLVLHGYVNYAGSALNYSGSPDYDLLRAIENGASLYYILSYQNTEALKEDKKLNKYYGVNYENWYDKVVETYATLNAAIGKYQNYNIVEHTTLLAERVIDPVESAANFKLLCNEFIALVEEQLKIKIDEAFENMASSETTLGLGVKVTLDTETLIAQAIDVLNVTKDELLATDFDEKLAALKAGYEAEYAGTENTPDAGKVNFSTVEYKSRYAYVTESLATDENYVYTEFTVDNDLVTMVTYENRETGHKVAFLINYNIYSVEVNLGGGHVYVLDKYDFEPITIGGEQNG